MVHNELRGLTVVIGCNLPEAWCDTETCMPLPKVSTPRQGRCDYVVKCVQYCGGKEIDHCNRLAPLRNGLMCQMGCQRD